jgi:hypothetical protein
MSTHLLNRLKQLENDRPKLPPPEACPRPMVGACIDQGEPLPDEAEVVPCRNCSGSHIMVIEEIVVGPEGAPT